MDSRLAKKIQERDAIRATLRRLEDGAEYVIDRKVRHSPNVDINAKPDLRKQLAEVEREIQELERDARASNMGDQSMLFDVYADHGLRRSPIKSVGSGELDGQGYVVIIRQSDGGPVLGIRAGRADNLADAIEATEPALAGQIRQASDHTRRSGS
jgi:hypothetical protein